MQVEAIYDHGRLEFVHPLQLKHDHVRLVVVVPDEEIVDQAGAIQQLVSEGIPEDVLKMAAEMAAQRDEILSQPFEDRQDGPLTEEQEQRMRAFAFRDQLRREQGHTS